MSSILYDSFFLYGILMLLYQSIKIEGRDSSGTEFIFGFLENSGYVNRKLTTDMEIYITNIAGTDVNVSISAPLMKELGLDSTFSIFTGENIRKIIPLELQHSSNSVENKGIHITASGEIVVHAINSERFSSDSFSVLPVDALGSEYYLLTWKTKATFKIIGVVDNTNITIMPPADASLEVDGVAFNDSFTFQLNRFQTFTYLNESSEFDLTGLRIISNQPVSIVSGNKRVSINGTSSDHLVEQMLPVDSWGKTFITIPLYNGWADYYIKIVASEDDTFITMPYNKTIGPIHRGHYNLLTIPRRTFALITTTKPVLAAMFVGSKTTTVNHGDPAMVIVPSIEHYFVNYSFATPKTNDGSNFYNSVSAVIRANDTSGLKLDGKTVSDKNWQEVEGTDEYKGISLAITPGGHTISHVDPNVNFAVLLFGTSRFDSYMMMAGLRIEFINKDCSDIGRTRITYCADLRRALLIDKKDMKLDKHTRNTVKIHQTW